MADGLALDSAGVSVGRWRLWNSIRLWRQPVSFLSGAGEDLGPSTSKPSTWTYSPETGPWLCGLGACEPASGWLVGREAVGVPGLLLLSGPFFLSPSPRAQSSVAPCQRCSLTGWRSLLGRRLTICESWPVSDQGPRAMLSHLGLSVLRNAGRARLAGPGGSSGAYPWLLGGLASAQGYQSWSTGVTAPWREAFGEAFGAQVGVALSGPLPREALHAQVPEVPGTVLPISSDWDTPRIIEAGAVGSLPKVSEEVLRVRVLGFPGGSDGKESVCSAGNLGSIPWRREWLPTTVSLPGEFCGQRSLVGYSPWGHKESGTDTTEWLILSGQPGRARLLSWVLQ